MYKHCVYVFNTEYASGSTSFIQTATCNLTSVAPTIPSSSAVIGKQINLTVIQCASLVMQEPQFAS